ncbi:MAG: hypothetical protein E6Q96_04115 [Cyclobacteriaceae bacterium]|nr:MAG: hypothetical protein E6Q96_04115 [Cyclobacteriaceae bacterium]
MDETRKVARENLGIPLRNKVILSIDGGGMRGIFTLQILKKLEWLAGSPCYKWCDMVAGTSTGGLISSLILNKKSTIEIEEIYDTLVSKVFTKRSWLANRIYNPPAYDKKNFRELTHKLVGDQTLKQLNAGTGLDMLFTAKDLAAGEETFFTCFKHGDTIKGTYQDVLLRAVMEATMSAPTYFSPFERFVDGGTTTFNNPVLAAVLEALHYDGKGKYKQNELTVFSFGTGSVLRFIQPSETKNPKGLDSIFWLKYVMAEASKDASEMQIDTLRSGLIEGLDLRRYQLSLDQEAVHKLPNVPIKPVSDISAATLHGLTDDQLKNIDMADVSKFELMKTLGQATAEFICPATELELPMTSRKANWFQKDFLAPNSKRGALVTARGDIPGIQKRLSSSDWIDKQQT